jgi:lactoylglutathione lyase
MKDIAFALDPDGYFVEIQSRKPSSIVAVPHKFTLAQTMLRVKNPIKTLHFYCDLLGMSLVCIKNYLEFSLYFLAHIPDEEKPNLPLEKTSLEASDYMRCMFHPVLEMTHNHGTENNPNFKYHNGNDQDEGQLRGFGHIGFLVDNLLSACDYLESEGVAFKKKPQEGNIKDIAFVYDPDNYWVEIIQRGGLKDL